MKNLHSSILDLIRELLNKFKRTNDSMRATTVDLMYNIKNAYFKFLRAHKLLTIVRSKASEILTIEILRRFKNNIEAIRSSESSPTIRVAELAHLLDL